MSSTFPSLYSHPHLWGSPRVAAETVFKRQGKWEAAAVWVFPDSIKALSEILGPGEQSSFLLCHLPSHSHPWVREP